MKTAKKKLTKAQRGMSTPPVKKVEYKSGNKTSFVQKNDRGTAVSTYKTKNPVNKTEVTKTGSINPKTNTVTSGKTYRAGSYGNTPSYKVSTYSDNKPTSMYKKEMDTTGYAAGKPTFTVNTYNRTAGKPATKTSKTVNRSQAKSLLKNMESSARKGKRGGIVKNKK
jgi:hypothetical protein